VFSYPVLSSICCKSVLKQPVSGSVKDASKLWNLCELELLGKSEEGASYNVSSIHNSNNFCTCQPEAPRVHWIDQFEPAPFRKNCSPPTDYSHHIFALATLQHNFPAKIVAKLGLSLGQCLANCCPFCRSRPVRLLQLSPSHYLVFLGLAWKIAFEIFSGEPMRS
jgi:hypothetical protein